MPPSITNRPKTSVYSVELWMYFHGNFVYIFVYLFFVNGRKLVRSAGTNSDGEFHGVSDINNRKTRSHVAGIRFGLNDLNFDKYKGSSNFRHKPLESSNQHKQNRFSQTSTGDYDPEFKHKILIPLDLNETEDTAGYYVQNKPDKTIYRTENRYLFAIVTSNGETLWKTKNGEYPNKVIYKTVDGRNRLKVYFPEPMPPPRISSLKVVRPVREKYTHVDRSRPCFKPSDPSKVTIEITDPHRPGYKFYRYVDPERIPTESLPKYIESHTDRESMLPLGEQEGLDHTIGVRLPQGVKARVPKTRRIALPMAMEIESGSEHEYEHEYEHGPEFKPEFKTEFKPEPKPTPKLYLEPELEPAPEPETGYEEDEPDMRHHGLIQYLTLNIKDKRSTEKYCFFEDIRTQTAFYFAKRGYLFNRVQPTNQCHAILHDLYYRWKAKKVFAKMVMVNGIDDVQPLVTIFLTNNHILFYRVAYINPIHLGVRSYDAQEELDIDDYPSNVRIFTSSGSGEQKNDTSKYVVYKYNVPTGSHPLSPNNLFYHFIFNSGKYLRITINKRLVWERTNSMRPQSLYYFEDLNLAIIEFDYYLYQVYKFQSDMWFMFYLDDTY